MSVKERLASAPAFEPVPFVLTSLNGENVNVKRWKNARNIREWWVYEHNDGKGRKYEDKLIELWKRCACEQDGTPISASDEEVKALVEKFGVAFLVEFDRAARRVNFLFTTNQEEDAERNRFFTERGLGAAKLSASQENTNIPETPASPSSENSVSAEESTT